MSQPWDDPRIRAGLAEQLSLRQRMLDEGARHVGWKVGFGAPAALQRLAIDAPLVGFLTDATIVDSGELVAVEGWMNGIVEFEVALRLGENLNPYGSDREVRSAVTGLIPAIELADVDFEPTADTVDRVLAGNIFHRGLVLGAPDPDRKGLDTSGLIGRILIDGEERHAVRSLTDLTGNHLAILRTLAGTLEANGLRLSAGDLVITGSIVAPIPVATGREFAFRLGSNPQISVGAS